MRNIMSFSKKNGLIFVPFMTGMGGTERVIQNLFEEINNRDLSIELKVESIGGSDNYDWSQNVPINVTFISKRRIFRTLFYLFCLPFFIFKKVKNNDVDFIISTNPIMWSLSKVSVRLLRRNTKIIAWYHYSLKQKPINKKLLNSADYYLAISSGIERQLIGLGVDSDKVSLIYNPVNTSNTVIPRPTRETKFLYIGRLDLDGQKNIRELLSALGQLKGDWKLDTYGDDSNRQEITDFAKQVGVEDQIRWHRFKEDVWSEINETTALVMTSKYEGLPMVLCEAISHGIYCISSDVETGPEDIINQNNGKLYAQGKVEELTSILQSIIDGADLPNSSVIIKTAEKFNSIEYLKRFENAVLKSLD